jgi:hypothetical protein
MRALAIFQIIRVISCQIILIFLLEAQQYENKLFLEQIESETESIL